MREWQKKYLKSVVFFVHQADYAKQWTFTIYYPAPFPNYITNYYPYMYKDKNVFNLFRDPLAIRFISTYLHHFLVDRDQFQIQWDEATDEWLAKQVKEKNMILHERLHRVIMQVEDLLATYIFYLLLICIGFRNTSIGFVL